ncbi:hypothetical protein O6H91_15G048700 [Diphasiastrum complanatum]|uniref:Uncharacterized protein n=1 Tax=Diphasiastrum complanatum TaxID=34168 RepID=A0ACC2BJ11_DIPCM|nr:hypothetical protein O6H91_15G048700 [Diphasiastrum complanatum]
MLHASPLIHRLSQKALCTTHEWLNQHMMDSLDNYTLESSIVSSSTTTWLYYPQEVQLWESMEEIKNYVTEADNQNHVHEKFSTMSFFKTQGKTKGKTKGVVSYIASNVLCQICNFLSKKTCFDIKVDFQVNLSAPNAPEESIVVNLATLRKVDAVINYEGYHIVVIELKRIGVLDLKQK